MTVLNDMNVPLFIEIKVISNRLEHRLIGDTTNFNDVMFCVKDHNFKWTISVQLETPRFSRPRTQWPPGWPLDGLSYLTVPLPISIVDRLGKSIVINVFPIPIAGQFCYCLLMEFSCYCCFADVYISNVALHILCRCVDNIVPQTVRCHHMAQPREGLWHATAIALPFVASAPISSIKHWKPT